MTASKFGTRPSRLLQLADAGVAFDFDNAAAVKLQQWEDERMAAMWGNGGERQVILDGPR
jgi:hypothetical protein